MTSRDGAHATRRGNSSPRPAVRSAFLIVVGVAILVAAWEIAARALHQTLILPGPVETLSTLFQEMAHGSFYRHLGATAARAVLGFTLSLVTGLVWGVAAGLRPAVRSVLTPALLLIRSTPVIAVILLAIVWFSPNAAPILVTWLMVVPVVEQVVEQGIRQTARTLLEMARVFRVPRSRVLRDIHLPGLRPYIVAASHSGLGMAYKVTVAAEVLIQPPWSIGGTMQEARFYLDTPRIIALTLTVILLSAVTEGLLRLADRAVDRGRRAQRGAASKRVAAGLSAEPPVGSRSAPESGAGEAPGISVHKVYKAFGPRLVLDEVTLTARRGEVTVLLGPSGCGKTTLLRIVAGLEREDSGTVESPDDAVTTMVFQEPRVLPWRTARENVSLVLGDNGGNGAMEWLERVGLSEFANYRPAALSGGMAQRLSLARAFAVRSDATLMDEPFQNLDLKTKVALCRMTRALHAKREGTTMFVTHDVLEASLVADRIVILSHRPARVLHERVNPLPDDARDPRSEAIHAVVTDLYDVLL